MEEETKVEKPKKTKKPNETVEAINALAEAILGLEKKVDEYYSLKPVAKLTSEQPSETPPMNPVTPEVLPFPFSWRMIIDETLSAKFKATVTYRSDAKFELSIWVPQDYSNAPKSHWDLMHEDKRFFVLENALGDAGVKQACEKILENLGQDIRFKMAQDKAHGS